MKYSLSIIIQLLLVSLIGFGQPIELEKLSNVKAALIIDSLESIKDAEYYDNGINYKLAFYYLEIDQEQSLINAHNFISLQDSTTSANNLYNIYRWLATIHKNKGSYDSTWHYLNLQKTIIENIESENNELLKKTYLGSFVIEGEKKTILGLSYLNFFLLLSIILIVTGFYIHIRTIKTKLSEVESLKNQELEAANTRLQKFNDDLQQAVMEKTYESAIELEKSSNEIVELRKSLRKAEEANYLKNAFLGTMSHQIRTPLSGIMGFSNILETELAIKGNEELYEFAKNIQEAGIKLMSLITNIIDISSIEANILELKISSCNLEDIFSETEKTYGPKAKDKGLIFKAKAEPGLPVVLADYNNLIMSISIILDNSVQYSSKGFVTLSAKYDTVKNMVEIEIKDKGSGIDDDTLEKLNNSFDYTKHGSSLTYQGHGLGLILAHRLITLMNGVLSIDSKTGSGTIVSITIPCLPNEQDRFIEKKIDSSEKSVSQKAAIVNAPEFGKLNIFVVEDDRMNRMVIEKMLKNSGKITTAVDGNDALKKIASAEKKNHSFDVFLLDMNLPAPWDGMKLMTEIRKKHPWTVDIPFIAQTAYAMAGDKDRYLDAGFNDYIAKPINKNELLTMIQTQLKLLKKNAE